MFYQCKATRINGFWGLILIHRLAVQNLMVLQGLSGFYEVTATGKYYCAIGCACKESGQSYLIIFCWIYSE